MFCFSCEFLGITAPSSRATRRSGRAVPWKLSAKITKSSKEKFVFFPPILLQISAPEVEWELSPVIFLFPNIPSGGKPKSILIIHVESIRNNRLNSLFIKCEIKPLISHRCYIAVSRIKYCLFPLYGPGILKSNVPPLLVAPPAVVLPAPILERLLCFCTFIDRELKKEIASEVNIFLWSGYTMIMNF